MGGGSINGAGVGEDDGGGDGSRVVGVEAAGRGAGGAIGGVVGGSLGAARGSAYEGAVQRTSAPSPADSDDSY